MECGRDNTLLRAIINSLLTSVIPVFRLLFLHWLSQSLLKSEPDTRVVDTPEFNEGESPESGHGHCTPSQRRRKEKDSRRHPMFTVFHTFLRTFDTSVRKVKTTYTNRKTKWLTIHHTTPFLVFQMKTDNGFSLRIINHKFSRCTEKVEVPLTVSLNHDI